jgi:hypothetical protein
MLSWITKLDKDAKVKIDNREDTDYPFALRIGYDLSVLLTEDEMSQLYTEVTESLFAFDFGKEKTDA